MTPKELTMTHWKCVLALLSLFLLPGYPHLYVLEKDGNLLYSKNTVELEEGRSYNEQAILDFLDEWMPER
jgi:hypothetical protein